MSVSSGTRLGPYEILSPLGAGGMGEVYCAADSRLKRRVAIKILPPALAADPDRLARFQREAEVLASLNHPHIATIFGLEDTPSTGSAPAGVKALVMELVEGPTLADRIAQGPIPLDEALPIAKQIAAALEAAHERGIVHRDLKPANIKVREDGTVKVLDFGLAKLAEPVGAGGLRSDDPSQSPTLTSPAMTGMGIILGTAAYMSPEQARGRAVDKRTDIWAFGAVLYEMLTAKRAFDGEDTTEIMAAVVKSTPRWDALPADVPPHIVTLIQRCLEKDRHSRIGDVAVARFLLDDHATAAPAPVSAETPSTHRQRSWRRAAPWVLSALIAGAAIGWLVPRRAAVRVSTTHLQMSVSPADQLGRSIASLRPARTAMAISPDGRQIAFAAIKASAMQLFLRSLERAEATPVPGTEGATAPFFSPDGAWIGFRVGNSFRKVPVAGGAPVTITEVDAGGASWGENDTIFLAGGDGISSVPSNGGTISAVTRREVAKRERHLLPQALPGGKAILFTLLTSGWETANVVLQVLATGERRVLVEGGADARYVSTGHLAYMKSGTLMVVPFDLRSLQVTGTPVAVVEGVMQAINAPNSADETGAGQFAVSATGTLLYVTGGVGRPLESTWVWVDRKGEEQPLGAIPTGPYLYPRLSPDGQKIAVTVRREAPDVWVYDVTRGAPTRLTVEGGTGPIWSPDGTRVAYAAQKDGVSSLHVVNADGSARPQQLAPSPFAQIPSSWSAATNEVAFLQRPQLESYGIWIMPMDGLQGARKPKLFLESRFTLSHAEFSPDGSWMAYVSRESGEPDVYVQPYPGPGEKIRISTAGGTEPIWTANGREILYRDERQFLSATIRSPSPFRVDPPRVLFATRGQYDSTSPLRSWNISADGERFLLSRFAEPTDKPVTAIHVVLDWAEGLKR